MRRLAAALITIALAAPAPVALAAEIEVTDAEGIALAVAISDAVDATTESITSCIDDGGMLQDCLCASAVEIAEVRAALDTALAAHPEWAGQTVTVADTGDGEFRSLTLFLDTVAASAAPPDCG